MKNLEDIGISHNNISKISEITIRPWLDLSYNIINEVPASIKAMKNKIDLSYNEVSEDLDKTRKALDEMQIITSRVYCGICHKFISGDLPDITEIKLKRLKMRHLRDNHYHLISL